MITTNLMVGFFCCLLWASVAASESYICVEDLATGFAFRENKKDWEIAQFKTDDKYIVSKQNIGHGISKESVWRVKRVGRRFGTTCDKEFSEDGDLYCPSEGKSLGLFRMNRKNLRFISVYISGYWDINSDNKEGDDTPTISIGKCSPFATE